MVKKRPGMFGKAEPGEGEEWTDLEDDKADNENDSDDDDQGGHMMPIPQWYKSVASTDSWLIR